MPKVPQRIHGGAHSMDVDAAMIFVPILRLALSTAGRRTVGGREREWVVM